MDKYLMDCLPGGWKTMTGGVSLIMLGISGFLVHAFAPDSGFAMDADSSLGAIAMGLGILGLGHKAERTRSDAERSRQKAEIIQMYCEEMSDRSK